MTEKKNKTKHYFRVAVCIEQPKTLPEAFGSFGRKICGYEYEERSA